MKRAKYIVERVPAEDFNDNEVYDVRTEGQAKWQAVAVWWDATRNRGHCCACSSATRGMSSSCVHVRAVKRQVSK